jgi:hypothetical protein
LSRLWQSGGKILLIRTKEPNMPTPNDDRSRVKDPIQPDFKASQDNRSRQLNPQQDEQEPAMDPGDKQAQVRG